jgi:DNA-binding Lrp family transcriptional regulator
VLAGVSRNSHIDHISDEPPAAPAAGLVDPATEYDFDPWSLVQAIAPRPYVRTQVMRPDGTVDPSDNTYPNTHPVASSGPRAPWAMWLADTTTAYRFLVFDFDAHSHPLEQARSDTTAFTQLLDDLTVDYVECESSPGRGYHVWVALAEPLPSSVAGVIADVAKRLYPTLDKGPINSAGTGLARTPGAPHRMGGASRILRGHPALLTNPTTTRERVHAIAAALDEIAPPAPPQHFTSTSTLTLIDVEGHPYLPGPKRPLGETARSRLLGQHSAHQDTSAVLYAALLGAARARWRYSDIEALLPTAPGLEHARTERTGRTRTPRDPRETNTILSRQWQRAVHHVATTKLTIARTPTVAPPRVAEVTHVVRAAQARANASPGAWAHTGASGKPRAIDRAVLDELHRRALLAVTTDVAVAVRTLSIALTVGREAVRQSLERLARDGRIRLTAPSDGAGAATWSIDPSGVIHREFLQTWSAMGGPSPHRLLASEAARQRREVLDRMTAAQMAAHHDAFLPRALGVQAGRVYGALSAVGPLTLAQLSGAAGIPADACREVVERLQEHGVIAAHAGKLNAAPIQVLDEVADDLGTTGVLDERAYRYRIEQATYSYWQSELAVTSRAIALPTSRVRHAHAFGTPPLALGAYPRTRDGRGDWREATDLIKRVAAA